MSPRQLWPLNRELSWYFGLAYVVSWLIWLPRIATVQHWWGVGVPEWWHYLGAAGPITAAILVSLVSGGRAEAAALMSRYSLRRAPVPWIAFAVASVLVMLCLGLVVSRLVDGAWPTYQELAKTSNLPAMGLPLTLLVHLVTFGIGEETGWRGFALPRLQSTRSAFHATHILALFWGLWHIPTFFENRSMMEMSALTIVGWAASLWMGAIFLTWLFNSANGSLLVIVIWHALFNQFSASDASSVVAAAVSMGVVLTAFIAIAVAGPEQLRGLSRFSGSRQQQPRQAAHHRVEAEHAFEAP
jgi:membrane protease YdiL (CAAX protease family)